MRLKNEDLVPDELVEEEILRLAEDIKDGEVEGAYSVFLFNAVRDAITHWQSDFDEEER